MKFLIKGQTKFFWAAHFAKRNTKNCGGEKILGLPRGRGGRGVQGGNSAAPERSAEAKRRRSVSLKEISRKV